MAFWEALFNGFVIGLIFLWDLFKEWIFIFISPKENFEILWIIIPIWITFIFTEIFQEKKGTGLGNAVTNGVVLLWVGIDWIRYLIRNYSSGLIIFDYTLVLKFFLCAFLLFLGGFIMYYGIKGRRYIAFIGRVRETSYLMLMFSPIIYGIISFSWKNILAIILFFPFFYFIIEMIDRYTPHPVTYDVDVTKKPESADVFMKDSIDSFDNPSSSFDNNNNFNDFNGRKRF
jgi:hypothetical protein